MFLLNIWRTTEKPSPTRPVTLVESEKQSMQRSGPSYAGAYRSLNLSRDPQGVLVVEFHTDGSR